MKLNHLAFNCKGSLFWALKKKKKPYEGYRRLFGKILEIVNYQIKKGIPITSFYLMPQTAEEPHDITLLIDEISAFLSELEKSEIIHKNKIKISVIGKWYSLPQILIDNIKKVIDSTKDYDDFFVNLCINYDGQEEIVDACKMVARRVKLGKIDIENVTKETIKGDLYSSYFMPPDYIFITGERRSYGSLLLWDSVSSQTVLVKKNFPDLTIKDIEKGIKD